MQFGVPEESSLGEISLFTAAKPKFFDSHPCVEFRESWYDLI